MPPRTANAMQRLAEGEGVRGVVATVLAERPLPRRDPMVARVVELIAAIAKKGDVRRALGDVAAVAEALDALIEPRTDAGELAIRALLEVLLDAADVRELRAAFIARLVERWVLVRLGHAPSDYFSTVAEHAQFRAEVGAVVREAARSLRATDLHDAIVELEEALRGGDS